MIHLESLASSLLVERFMQERGCSELPWPARADVACPEQRHPIEGLQDILSVADGLELAAVRNLSNGLLGLEVLEEAML